MIHSHALVEDPESIAENTNVWAFAHVMSGARIGSHCNIGDHAFIETGAIVGNNVTLKNQVMVWDGITIEDDVFVGPGVVFTNDRCPRSPRAPGAAQRYRDKSTWLQTTVLRRGCSIGAASVICPGVEIEPFAVVGAGSVVTKKVEAFSQVLGSPARFANYICSCGQRLAGHYLQSDCLACGETGSARAALIQADSSDAGSTSFPDTASTST